jgi:hypothetical protein
MGKLREELRVRVSREKLGHAWQLEALDRIFTVSQANPKAFHRLWIEPLLAAARASTPHLVTSLLPISNQTKRKGN